MTTRNRQPTTTKRSTRSTRMTTPESQPIHEPVAKPVPKKSTRKSTRPAIIKKREPKPKVEESVHIEDHTNSDGVKTRAKQWGSIREAQAAMRPVKTMVFMFVTIVIFFIAFGILYQNTSDFRSSPHDSTQLEQASDKNHIEIINRKRNTSTNTQILQQDID